MDRSSLYNLMVQAGMKKIQQTGEGFAALCPFHDNNKSPAWNINADTGLWRCWNDYCGAKGNFVTFLIRVARMPYDEAVEYADNVPIVGKLDIEEWRLPAWEKRFEQEQGKFVEEAVLGLYSRCPMYMVQRGFPKSFLKLYDVGWDENGYEHKGRVIGMKRVTFPVRDPYGRLMGFTRRTVGEEWPKYLHDFEKTQTLYLVDRVKKGSVLGVTEGPTDALRARLLAQGSDQIPLSVQERAAFTNMVATLGGGLADNQADLISELQPELVITAFDNDVAGISATKKSLRKLRERGVGNLLCLTFPSHDLGDLDLDKLVDVESQSTYRWLSHH